MATSKTSSAAAETSPDNEPTNVDEIPTMADLRGISYVGMADSKTLLVEDLEAMGIESPKEDLVWDGSNDRFVSSDRINAATRDLLLADPNFLAV
jgi:hypothetical protein